MKPKNDYELMCLLSIETSSNRTLLDMYDSGLHMEDGAALLATAMGVMLGKLQIDYEMHAENCTTCSKRFPDFFNTFVTNFTESYQNAHSIKSKDRSDGVSAADEFVKSIFDKERKR